MFKRKDVIRTLYLLAVILVIMVTLSQILVVHRRNHNSNRYRDTHKAHEMLAMLQHLEKGIETMMKKEYLPTRTHEEQLLALIYVERIKQYILKLNIVDQISEEQRHRKFGDNTYTAFHERKLRFLEVTENELTPTSSIENEVNKKEVFMHEINYKTNENIETSIKLNDDAGTVLNSKYSVNMKGNKSINNEKLMQNFKPVQKRMILNKYVYDQNYSISHAHNQTNTGTSKHHTQTMGALKDNPAEKCPDIPSNLEGKTVISSRVPDHLSDELRFSDIQLGGFWKPITCVARQRTAIIIPYRNRETHLHTLLHYLIPVLKRQLLEFRIFVFEQFGNMTFNKGRVMNAGFMEAWKLWTFDCVIFHDVDLLPENDKNMYTCGQFPRHMSISVDKFSYRLPYWTLVGGVFSIKREQFLRVNGYSNLYWGWGAEDDDMAQRLKSSHLKIERPPANIGRYKMIKHENRETSPMKIRAYLLKTVKNRYRRDGLNTLDYSLVFVNNTKLYTHVMVDIGQPPLEATDIAKLLI